MRFWTIMEELRKRASRYYISDEAARLVLSPLSSHELLSFRRDLKKWVQDAARWDLWGVGTILCGHPDPSWFDDFGIWILMQGEEFYRTVLKDPRRVIDRAPSQDPVTSFSQMDLVWSIPGSLYFARTKDYLKEQRLELGPLAGKPWSWKELADLHPELWTSYFLKRDRRAHFPKQTDSENDLLSHAFAPLRWVDFYGDPDYLVAQYATLNEDQVSLHSSYWCHLESQNGGMDQFFYNSTGAVAKEALEGFKRLGALEHHQDLAQIMKAFPLGGPVRDRDAREAQMRARWGDKNIDDEFVGKGLPELEPILETYIRDHPQSFFRDP